ncbi:hypothetical protein EVAR_9183_1 [Eumeta japonica]|uniref:FLYWCH-type domain-containing protein n=1 Tax=Eumeta variegata TaxID=151549 RepID=A0A4C1WLW2_EUMVA|nr:hypothetical protein EVAR_9183_1 [Eumeta japonica]
MMSRGALNLRIASFAGNSPQFMRCTVYDALFDSSRLKAMTVIQGRKWEVHIIAELTEHDTAVQFVDDAIVNFIDALELWSQRGCRMLLHKGYTYTKHNYGRSKNGWCWRCSTHRSRGCNAKLYTNDLNEITDVKCEHTHTTFQMLRDCERQICKIIMVELQSQRGKKLLLYEGHTYTKHKHGSTPNKFRWDCSTHHSKGCNAKIYTDDVNRLIDKKGIHRHDPRKYHITSDGRYIPI